MLVPNEITYFCSSNPANGAKLSSNKSSFEFKLADPLEIPRDAINPNLHLETASIWYDFFNISAEKKNNHLYLSCNDITGEWAKRDIVIPNGLYSLAGLNSMLTILFEEYKIKTNPLPPISIHGVDATQKCYITVNYEEVVIDFELPNTFASLLGFPNEIIGPFHPTELPKNVYGSSVAQFNSTNSINLHCDLVNKGIPTNGTYSSIIAHIPIDIAPNTLLVFDPSKPTNVECENLKGTTINNMRIWLTN